MSRTRYNRQGIYLLLIVFSTMLMSCGEPIGGSGKSPVFLYVTGADEFAVVSDVYSPSYPGGVSADTADVVIHSMYKDQTNTETVVNFADVIIQEYRVHYYRYDGNPNVPEPFVRFVNLRVEANQELDLTFIVIRSMAKLQSPLRELAFGGGEGVLWLTAHVEFYGEDLAGNAVSTETTIAVRASDFPG